MALFARFLGRTASEGAAFAFGRASSPVLSPAVELLRQQAWTIYPHIALEPGTLAAGVAQGQVEHDWAQGEAERHGVNGDRFDRLVTIASVGPGMAAAFDLWRRGIIPEGRFRAALKRNGIEAEWIDDLVQTKRAMLDPADLARGIHRGLIPDPGLLRGELPSGEGHVPAYPVYDIDALQEAAAHGFERDDLGVLVGLQGLPMGSHEAAEALFRGILTHDDYLRAIAEGNTRNEWAEAIREQTRQIPTARDFLENALRGYRTLREALAGAARHGMSEDDATMIYQNQGRPMNVHQITQALARGGKFEPEPGEITDPYDASIVEGNLKPAYYDLAKALRYTMPSPFVMRQLAGSGVWSEAKTAERLKWAGWFPVDADEAAKAWAGSGDAATDTHVAKAQTQLWTTTHRSYIAAESDDAAATGALERAGVAAAAVPAVLELWKAERDLIRKQLTPAQITKAYNKAAINPITDQPWTREEAMAALIERGYSGEQAAALLNIPSGQ